MSATRCSRLAKSIHGPFLARLAEWHAADDDELVANMAAQACWLSSLTKPPTRKIGPVGHTQRLGGTAP